MLLAASSRGNPIGNIYLTIPLFGERQRGEDNPVLTPSLSFMQPELCLCFDAGLKPKLAIFNTQPTLRPSAINNIAFETPYF